MSIFAGWRSDPKGTRTPVTAVKGRCPRPLDDGAGGQGVRSQGSGFRPSGRPRAVTACGIAVWSGKRQVGFADGRGRRAEVRDLRGSDFRNAPQIERKKSAADGELRESSALAVKAGVGERSAPSVD